MGIVFQNYALFENMTVLGNVEYALRAQKECKTKAQHKEARRKALDMIKRVGLTEHLSKKPHQLSGGQQQRVAIARTLVMNPDIILFDEPMSALDVATRLALRKEIKFIQKDLGITILYVTHDQEEAFAMSDRILVMDEAHIAQIDTPMTIMQSPSSDYVKEFVVHNMQKKISSLLQYASKSGEDI